jgi:hypothetical protein
VRQAGFATCGFIQSGCKTILVELYRFIVIKEVATCNQMQRSATAKTWFERHLSLGFDLTFQGQHPTIPLASGS